MKKLLLILSCLPSVLFGQNQLAGSMTLTNTGGGGFLQIANQSSAPSTPTASGRIYFDTGNDFAWKEAGGFVGKIDLSGANRTMTLSGSPTLGDWFDQSVKVAASPTFVTGTFTKVVTATSTPASAGASGVAGTITWDTSFIYVCVSTNTWKRAAISTW